MNKLEEIGEKLIPTLKGQIIQLMYLLNQIQITASIYYYTVTITT